MTILRKEDKEFLNKVKNQPKAPPVKQEGLSERIDNKLMEMAQKSPVIGKFFASAVGSAKGLVEHPINTLRGLAGGIVSAPEKLLRTLKTEVDLALTGNKSRYDKETGKPIIYIENGIPVIKKQKTLAGLISGDENMGQAVRYDDPNFTRKTLSAGAETGLNFLIPGLKGLSTAKKIALGTGLGAGYGVTSEAQNDNPDYVAGAGAGTGMGLLFSGVGALASKKGRGGKVVEEPIKNESVVKDLSEPKEEIKPLNSLNPSEHGVFEDYNKGVKYRATAPLGDDITTYDVTSKVEPNKKIVIYRGGKGEIQTGDFITTNKKLAEDYAGTNKVYSKEVNASDILDSKSEPLGEEYIYRPQVKDKVITDTTLPSIDINTGRITKGKITEDTTLPSIDINTGKITKAKIINNIVSGKKEVVDSGVIPDEYSGGSVETKLSRDLRQKYPELEATNYEPKTIKEITDNALQIKEKAPQQFEDVSLGKKTTGNRGLDAKIQEIAINEADKMGDIEKIQELLKNRVRSEAGQNLGLMQVEAGSEWSLSNMINKVKQNYQENIKGIKADNIERIKQNGKKVLQDAKKMKIEELNNFLNDIIC